MRKRILGAAGALAILVAVAPAAAQQHQHGEAKKADAAQTMDGGMMKGMETGWKALDGFHALMHEAHHGLMKTGDVQPARRLAADMAAAARTLAASAAPATCKADDLAARASWLAVSTSAFAKLVADGADDSTVKVAVNGVHDLMEPIVKACRHEH